jgi:hypothetical protein
VAAKLRPESLTLGLFLVALGTIALLHNFGRVDFLETVRTFWPLTLLVWGVLELAASLKGRAERRS